MEEIELKRDASMRGFLIRSNNAKPVAYVVKKKLLGGEKIIPLKEIILCDRVFRHTRLRLQPLKEG